MDRTNIQFLNEQITTAISKLQPNFEIENIEFTISFDPEEKQEPKTTFDEIMFFRVIPEVSGRSLSLEQVCDILVDGKNEIPLWIRLNTSSDHKVELLISKRFRKKKIINEWHGENIFKPIIL